MFNQDNLIAVGGRYKKRNKSSKQVGNNEIHRPSIAYNLKKDATYNKYEDLHLVKNISNAKRNKEISDEKIDTIKRLVNNMNNSIKNINENILLNVRDKFDVNSNNQMSSNTSNVNSNNNSNKTSNQRIKNYNYISHALVSPESPKTKPKFKISNKIDINNLRLTPVQENKEYSDVIEDIYPRELNFLSKKSKSIKNASNTNRMNLINNKIKSSNHNNNTSSRNNIRNSSMNNKNISNNLLNKVSNNMLSNLSSNFSNNLTNNKISNTAKINLTANFSKNNNNNVLSTPISINQHKSKSNLPTTNFLNPTNLVHNSIRATNNILSQNNLNNNALSINSNYNKNSNNLNLNANSSKNLNPIVLNNPNSNSQGIIPIISPIDLNNMNKSSNDLPLLNVDLNKSLRSHLKEINEDFRLDNEEASEDIIIRTKRKKISNKFVSALSGTLLNRKKGNNLLLSPSSAKLEKEKDDLSKNGSYKFASSFEEEDANNDYNNIGITVNNNGITNIKNNISNNNIINVNINNNNGKYIGEIFSNTNNNYNSSYKHSNIDSSQNRLLSKLSYNTKNNKRLSSINDVDFNELKNRMTNKVNDIINKTKFGIFDTPNNNTDVANNKTNENNENIFANKKLLKFDSGFKKGLSQNSNSAISSLNGISNINDFVLNNNFNTNSKIQDENSKIKPLKTIRNIKGRLAHKFKNVYDSFDSSEEEKDYNYEDYIPRRYSVSPESDFFISWTDNSIFIYYISLLFYTIMTIFKDSDIFTSFTNLFLCSLLEIYYMLNFIFQYVLVAIKDIYVNKYNYNTMNILAYNLKSRTSIVIIDMITSIPIALIISISLFFKSYHEYLFSSKIDGYNIRIDQYNKKHSDITNINIKENNKISNINYKIENTHETDLKDYEDNLNTRNRILIEKYYDSFDNNDYINDYNRTITEINRVDNTDSIYNNRDDVRDIIRKDNKNSLLSRNLQSTVVEYNTEIFDSLMDYKNYLFIRYSLNLDLDPSLNFNRIFKLYFVSKLLLLIHLRKWIHFSSIFQEKNKNIEKTLRDKGIKKQSSDNSLIFASVKIFLFFFMISHVTSCLWIAITDKKFIPNKIENATWIYEFREDSLVTIYLASLYFSIATLLTIGYGDVFPNNSTERIYIIFVLCCGLMIYSFVLTIVSSLLSSKDVRKKFKDEKIFILMKLSKEYFIPHDLYLSIEQSIEYQFKNWHGDKEELISILPGSLKVTLLLKMYENMIKRIDFFNTVQDSQFILDFASKLRSNYFDKKYYILQEGENIEEMYFVVEGSFLIRLSNDLLLFKLAKICTGMHYGDILMYSYTRSPFNFQVNSGYCSFLTLKKQDFSELKLNYESIISDFLKQSYMLHFYIENKKMKAMNYYNNYFTLDGFEELHLKDINREILRDLEIEDGPLSKKVTFLENNEDSEDNSDDDFVLTNRITKNKIKNKKKNLEKIFNIQYEYNTNDLNNLVNYNSDSIENNHNRKSKSKFNSNKQGNSKLMKSKTAKPILRNRKINSLSKQISPKSNIDNTNLISETKESDYLSKCKTLGKGSILKSKSYIAQNDTILEKSYSNSEDESFSKSYCRNDNITTIKTGKTNIEKMLSSLEPMNNNNDFKERKKNLLSNSNINQELMDWYLNANSNINSNVNSNVNSNYFSNIFNNTNNSYNYGWRSSDIFRHSTNKSNISNYFNNNFHGINNNSNYLDQDYSDFKNFVEANPNIESMEISNNSQIRKKKDSLDTITLTTNNQINSLTTNINTLYNNNNINHNVVNNYTTNDLKKTQIKGILKRNSPGTKHKTTNYTNSLKDLISRPMKDKFSSTDLFNIIRREDKRILEEESQPTSSYRSARKKALEFIDMNKESLQRAFSMKVKKKAFKEDLGNLFSYIGEQFTSLPTKINKAMSFQKSQHIAKSKLETAKHLNTRLTLKDLYKGMSKIENPDGFYKINELERKIFQGYLSDLNNNNITINNQSQIKTARKSKKTLNKLNKSNKISNTSVSKNHSSNYTSYINNNSRDSYKMILIDKLMTNRIPDFHLDSRTLTPKSYKSRELSTKILTTIFKNSNKELTDCIKKKPTRYLSHKINRTLVLNNEEDISFKDSIINIEQTNKLKNIQRNKHNTNTNFHNIKGFNEKINNMKQSIINNINTNVEEKIGYKTDNHNSNMQYFTENLNNKKSLHDKIDNNNTMKNQNNDKFNVNNMIFSKNSRNLKQISNIYHLLKKRSNNNIAASNNKLNEINKKRPSNSEFISKFNQYQDKDSKNNSNQSHISIVHDNNSKELLNNKESKEKFGHQSNNNFNNKISPVMDIRKNSRNYTEYLHNYRKILQNQNSQLKLNSNQLSNLYRNSNFTNSNSNISNKKQQFSLLNKIYNSTKIAKNNPSAYNVNNSQISRMSLNNFNSNKNINTDSYYCISRELDIQYTKTKLVVYENAKSLKSLPRRRNALVNCLPTTKTYKSRIGNFIETQKSITQHNKEDFLNDINNIIDNKALLENNNAVLGGFVFDLIKDFERENKNKKHVGQQLNINKGIKKLDTMFIQLVSSMNNASSKKE